MDRFVKHLRQKWYCYFFAVAVVFTLCMDIQIIRTILDGDTSDMMNRAFVMARENNPFTTNYYGTTELRLFDISFIMAPFFKLFSNWTLVRLCATVLLQAVYILSFQYLITSVVTSKAVKWAASGLLLMPFSTAYARIVLYHLHYIVYISYAFLLLGMLLRLAADKREKTGRKVLRLCLMAVLWVIVGLNGVRHMMILLAPMLLLAVILLFVTLKRYHSVACLTKGENAVIKKPVARLFILLLISCVFYGVGYFINKNILLPLYGLTDMGAMTLMPVPANSAHYPFIFSHFLTDIGFRTSSASAVSIRSVAIAAALSSFGYLFWASFRYGYLAGSQESDCTRTILYGFLSATFCLTTFVFLFDTRSRCYELYYVPVVVMAFPVLTMELDRLKDRALSLARRLMICLTCAAFLFQGAYTASFVFHKSTSDLDIWSGLRFDNVMAVDCVRDCVDLMHIYGYTHGIAPYWFANVMVECSDGTLAITSYGESYEGSLSQYRWGTSKTSFRPENLPEKMIVFIDDESVQQFTTDYPDSKAVFEGAYFTGYEVDAALAVPWWQPAV